MTLTEKQSKLASLEEDVQSLREEIEAEKARRTAGDDLADRLYLYSSVADDSDGISRFYFKDTNGNPLGLSDARATPQRLEHIRCLIREAVDVAVAAQREKDAKIAEFYSGCVIASAIRARADLS